MKTIAKFGLTALACFVLSACGSSGGGDNASSQPTTTNNGGTAAVTPSTPSTPSTSSTPSTPSTPSVDTNTTGATYVLSGYDKDIKVTKKSLTDASNLNVIVVDGKSLRIAYQDLSMSADTWSTINSTQSCCGKYSDVRFGIYDINNDDGYIFYNGRPTQSMPTSGTATYTGHFIVDGDDNYPVFDNEEWLKGTAQFNADFAQKTLSGTLSQESLQPINVQATISGNSFSGTAKSSSFQGAADLEGKFYGTNAKELGGIFSYDDYKSDNSWGGAFGAAQ